MSYGSFFKKAPGKDEPCRGLFRGDVSIIPKVWTKSIYYLK